MNEKQKEFRKQLQPKQKIILTDAAINGIKGATEKEIEHSPKYEKLVEEANKEIEEARQRERNAWISAKSYLAK